MYVDDHVDSRAVPNPAPPRQGQRRSLGSRGLHSNTDRHSLATQRRPAGICVRLAILDFVRSIMLLVALPVARCVPLVHDSVCESCNVITASSHAMPLVHDSAGSRVQPDSLPTQSRASAPGRARSARPRRLFIPPV